MVRRYYIIIEDDGIFKQGMRCYCFAQDTTHLFLFFEKPVIGDIHEIKLPKNKSNLLKPM